jgi:hypothetical protein
LTYSEVEIIPDSLLRSAYQESGADKPSGDTAPRPVITTLFSYFILKKKRKNNNNIFVINEIAGILKMCFLLIKLVKAQKVQEISFEDNLSYDKL